MKKHRKKKSLILKLPQQGHFDDESMELFNKTIENQILRSGNCKRDERRGKSERKKARENSVKKKVSTKILRTPKKKPKFIDYSSISKKKKKVKSEKKKKIVKEKKIEFQANPSPQKKKRKMELEIPKLNFEKSDSGKEIKFLERNDSFVTLGTFDLTESEIISPAITQREFYEQIQKENFFVKNLTLDVKNQPKTPPNSGGVNREESHHQEIDFEISEKRIFNKKKRVWDSPHPPKEPKKLIEKGFMNEEGLHAKTPSFYNQSQKSKNSRKCSFEENLKNICFEELNQNTGLLITVNKPRSKEEGEEINRITVENIQKLSQIVGQMHKSEVIEKKKKMRKENIKVLSSIQRNTPKRKRKRISESPGVRSLKRSRRNSCSKRKNSLKRQPRRVRWSGERTQSKEKMKEQMLKRLIKAQEGPRTSSGQLKKNMRKDRLGYINKRVDDTLNSSLRF